MAGPRTADRRARGFTLVEMALIVIIVGMIAAAVLPRVVKNMQRDFVKSEKTTLRAARDELIGAVLEDCTMPVAADLQRLKGRYLETLMYATAPNLTSGGANGTAVLSVTDSGWDLDTDGDGAKDIDDVAFFVYSPGKDKTDEFTPTASYPAGSIITMPGWGEEGMDDIIDYVTLGYLQSLCTGTGAGSDLNINFDSATMQENFADPVSYTASGGTSNAVTVNDDGTITLGANSPDDFGCIWYTGSNDICTNGNCTFGTGFRAFFQFQFNSTGDIADGFTFAAISAETNNGAACGGISDGGSQGETLGYAGPGVSGHGIQEPKFAIEFDIYTNGCNTLCSASGNRCDTDRDTVSFTYWGDNSTACSPASNTWDDNRHAAGLQAYYTPNAPENQSFGDSGWMGAASGTVLYGNAYTPRSGQRYLVRMEVTRSENATVYVAEPTERYQYNLKAWIAQDQTVLADFYDTENDYTSESPTIEDTIELSTSYHNLLDNILVGWTEGTGGLDQELTLLKFDLTFRQ